MNKLYYAIVTRNGWCELHVSRNKKEVLKLNALSRKIPVHSNLLEDFKIEAKREMEQYRAVDISGEIFSNLKSITPGTWVFSEELSAVVTIEDHKVVMIADLGKCDNHAINGQLMSASRELFEALKITCESLLPNDPRRLIALAAIQKAEGK